MDCLPFRVIVNKVPMNTVHKAYCGHIFSFLLDKHLGVKLLGRNIYVELS